MMEAPAQLTALVIGGGFALGAVFGAVAQKTDFCTMGAVSDVLNMGDWSRMRMWLLAIAVAIAGANALDLAGLVDLSRSAYPAPRWPWLAYLVGGLLFGVGMTLASGCGSRSLIRIGSGNVKSLVAMLFLALAAAMTLRGVLAPLRTDVLNAACYSVRPRPGLVMARRGRDRHRQAQRAAVDRVGYELSRCYPSC
jgi:uncharacterized membrane protein YedE/YeeE